MTAPRVFSDEYYQRLYAVEQSHWYVWGMRQIAQTLLAANGFRETGCALDAGCGTGGTLQWLTTLFPRLSVVGLDVAGEALHYVRGRNNQLARRVVRGSVTDLPFAASTFDLVVSFDVLQHLPDSAADLPAIREAARVLRPGGFLLVRAAAVRRTDPPEASAPHGYHRFRLGELVDNIQKAELSVRQATFANCLLSLVDDLRQALRSRRRTHRADPGLAIRPPRHAWLSAGQRGIMWLEAMYLMRGGRRLPFGHSLVVVAVKEASAGGG